MDLRHLRIDGDPLRVHLENVHGIGDAEDTSSADQLALHIRMHRAPASQRPHRSTNDTERWPAHPGVAEDGAEEGAGPPDAPNAVSRLGYALVDHLSERGGMPDSEGHDVFWDWLQDLWDDWLD